MHSMESGRREQILESAFREDTHFERGSVASVKAQILENLDGSIAPAVDQHGASAGRGQRVLVQIRKMLLGAVPEFVRRRQQQKAIGLEHPVQITERMFDRGRNVLQDLA